MTYELVAQLKDAGFPKLQDYATGYVMMNDGLWPTLSELIEACGEGFENLKRRNGIEAQGMYPFCTNYIEDLGTGESAWDTEGSTPEEAVAKLWLALNAKEEGETRD